MAKTRIGFIGLGAMGKPIAKRLLDHGLEVVSCARVNRAAIEELKQSGLIEAASPAEVADGADQVITIVRDTAETEEAVLGERGALGAMKPGSTLIIMSTIDPNLCRLVADEAKARDVAVIDCPVSGFPFKAAEGTLALMAGGEAAAIERCRPSLEALGQIFLCGDVGMGMVTKLANNAVAFATMGMLLEVRNFARSFGLAEDDLMEVLKSASANSFIAQNWDAIRGMWDNVIDLATKDAGICLEVAEAAGIEMPLTTAATRFPWPTES